MQSRFILLALLSALLMGTIGVFARFTALGAEQITFYRLLFGALFLLGYMWLTGKGKQVLHRPSKRHILNGAMLAGFMAFYVEAIGYTSTASRTYMVTSGLARLMSIFCSNPFASFDSSPFTIGRGC
jgi:drug/metabolite transporter (DMT)-like permease